MRTERHDKAVERRTLAGIVWLREAFAAAGESGKGLFLTLHATMGLEQKPKPDPPHFQRILDVLREETERFGRPVVLAPRRLPLFPDRQAASAQGGREAHCEFHARGDVRRLRRTLDRGNGGPRQRERVPIRAENREGRTDERKSNANPRRGPG